MQKPVWRINTGNGVPSDFGGSVALCYGEVLKVCEMFTYRDFRIVKDCINIAAYQTTRTKAAKYRRVECVECKSSKYKGLVYCGGYFEYRECPSCVGYGARWEKLPCKQ